MLDSLHLSAVGLAGAVHFALHWPADHCSSELTLLASVAGVGVSCFPWFSGLSLLEVAADVKSVETHLLPLIRLVAVLGDCSQHGSRVVSRA